MRARVVARSLFAAVLLLLGLWTARSFLPAVAWAVIISTTLWPAYAWVARKTSFGTSSSSLALLFTMFVAIIIVSPIFLALDQLTEIQEPAKIWIEQARKGGIPVPVWIEKAPLAGEHLAAMWRGQLGTPQAIASMLSGLDADAAAEWFKATGGNLLHRMVIFAFSLLATFFLFRDGEWISERAMRTADRLLGGAGESLARKMVKTLRGTVNATVLVALVEGGIIGIVYFATGVPKALLFTILTTTFATLPFGAWVAFTGASLTLVAQGGPPALGAVVFGWGAIVMLVGDHFLWLSIIGKTARLPFLLALIGIFGGLQAFGLVGLFAGPIVMAGVLVVWREWLAIGR